MSTSEKEKYYVPKDALGEAAKGTFVMGAAGAFMSAVQNSLAKQNIGAAGFITRTGSSIGLFAAMGATYSLAKSASANLREKDDFINPALGGFLAGAIMGTKFRTLSAVLGYGAALGGILGVFEYTGGSLSSLYKDATTDEFTKRELFRATRRRSVDELVENLNENHHVHAPGYEVRRRERLREKYGIVVPE